MSCFLFSSWLTCAQREYDDDTVVKLVSPGHVLSRLFGLPLEPQGLEPEGR